MSRGARLPALLLALGAIIALGVGPAMAQKSGGILKLYHRDSPGSVSIHEEATISSIAPLMGVFNNLVLFNQQETQNRIEDSSSRTSPTAGRGTTTTPASASSCITASNGMTASRSPPRTSSAPGIC